MTETFIAHVNGSHACYQTRTGIDRAFIGCTHDTPREAIDHTTERKGDTSDARDIRDHLRPSLDLTSRPVLDRLTPSPGGVEDNSPAQDRAPGHPADGPRRPAPTGVTPPAPVGAPDLGLVP